MSPSPSESYWPSEGVARQDFETRIFAVSAVCRARWPERLRGLGLREPARTLQLPRTDHGMPFRSSQPSLAPALHAFSNSCFAAARDFAPPVPCFSMMPRFVQASTFPASHALP